MPLRYPPPTGFNRMGSPLQNSVLITSAGRRVGLLNAVRESLSQLGLRWRVIAADAVPSLSAACHLADVSYRLPPATSDGYTEELLQICRDQDVKLLIPTIDPELIPLSVGASAFEKVGVRINVAATEFVSTARDKVLTRERLIDVGVPTPETWPSTNAFEEDPRFPAISKPRDGSSSVGIVRYASIEQYRRNPPPKRSMVQELLEGPEYTVNVFCDREGHFRCAVPHRRLEVRSGEVSKGRTERRADLTALAEAIASLPGARGAFCFQAIVTDRGPMVFEINARFGGGFPLAHRAGGTFVKWLLEECVGMPSTADDVWQNQLIFLRYDSEVFVP